MAVRQYIGARYAPRFVGTYNATQSYDALDVVDNGQGTSYIAKIPTPANTPLTDSICSINVSVSNTFNCDQSTITPLSSTTESNVLNDISYTLDIEPITPSNTLQYIIKDDP